MKINLQKGFTLIELLVVVAIISLLSSIVLAVVNDARDKAQQTAYRQYLGEMIKAIELYKLNGGDPATFVMATNYWDGFPKEIFESGGVLNPYLKWQNPPSFVGAIDEYQLGIAFRDYVGSFTCSDTQIDEYVLVFVSLRSDLKFNKYKENGVHYQDSNSLYYYCVSPSTQ
jgi:prepilin-type N-terminal cleavage/methylation domain-containing protein